MTLGRYQVKDKGEWKLDRHDPDDNSLCSDKKKAAERLRELKADLAEQQQLLYASNEYGLLLVLQAIDAGGKDGTIRHVMSGVNPQGCHVSSFKAPSAVEANHDYLWRIHHSVAARGRFVIFNRSHYEDVLVVRVHPEFLPPWAARRKNLWQERFEQINNFEKHLVENNIIIVKCFLHISKDEQRQRFERRLKDPARNWKFAAADVNERRHWDQYMEAFEDAFRHTSTDWAPWYIIPADRKWYRDLVIAELLVKTLKELKLSFPKGDAEELEKIVIPD
ncbi:MAG: polyphosphate kinase 2 family protein [bacterium]|nr:polyphosphate kinase 2 family protein [bacterium]